MHERAPRWKTYRLLFAVAVLCSSFLGCDYNEDDHEYSSTELAEAIQVEPLNDEELPADGFSMRTLRVILTDASSENRLVRIHANAGALVNLSTGAVPETPAVLDVRATSSDEGVTALFGLRSSRFIKEITVTASVVSQPDVIASETLRFSTVEVIPDIISSIEAADGMQYEAEIPAPSDSGATLPIIVTVNPGLLPTQRDVTFETTRGTFAPTDTPSTTVTAGPQNRVTAVLASPDGGEAQLTIRVNGFEEVRTIRFTE